MEFPNRDGRAPESPPNTPTDSRGMRIPLDLPSPTQQCVCGSLPLGSLSASHANQLADTLGVSPLYKQQASARWNAAAQVYRSSRAHSPTQEVAFSFPDTNFINSSPNGPPISKTPLSLEDIANMNRKRHEEGISITPVDQASAPLELEAIAAVHELATQVESISVSEMLPHTPDLIFVNLKTQEEQPYTLELTMKGWRIASSQTDSMNGDYMKIGLHTMYYRNAAELLHVISPNHISRFNECVAERLTQLAQIREGIST
ncbi:hypothetical protein WR25_15687 [Diploscapter pachys]|uniref:GSKIP domain-containing protein n=1 Tax=Diploscapter pachys TaxID=2018661 RepID=A0A2A2J387_9BILA|nr:hypothetical protein WR25_15687 [Diploscapter pachys]